MIGRDPPFSSYMISTFIRSVYNSSRGMTVSEGGANHRNSLMLLSFNVNNDVIYDLILFIVFTVKSQFQNLNDQGNKNYYDTKPTFLSLQSKLLTSKSELV